LVGAVGRHRQQSEPEKGSALVSDFLTDPLSLTTGRRASYDRLRTSKPSSSYASNPTADASSFFNFFSSRAGAPADFDDAEEESEYGQPDAEYVFGNVFEDMLRPEVGHLFFVALSRRGGEVCFGGR
jgi:hypothetical protein